MSKPIKWRLKKDGEIYFVWDENDNIVVSCFDKRIAVEWSLQRAVKLGKSVEILESK